MGRPLWQIDADIKRLEAERRTVRGRTFKPANKLRSFKPEAKGQRDPRQVDPGFMTWLHVDTDCIACLIEGRPAQPGPIEAAHQKLAIASKGWREGGLGPRVHDHRCAPLCAWHHRHASNSCDTGGQRKFWDRLGLGDRVADFCRDLHAAYTTDEPAMPIIRAYAASSSNREGSQ